jgi:hypothetical protein
VEYEALPLLGAPFESVETYVYFDGRQTFAMRSTVMSDLYYVVNTVDENDDGTTLTALAVAMNGDRFRAVRSGLVPFRDTFERAAPFSMFRIVWTFLAQGAPFADIEPVRAADVPSAWLPAESARLKLPTATVEPFVSNELVSMAEAQGRTIFAVEVETPGARITGFPGRNAGELQTAIDSEVAALTREIVGKGKTPHVQEIRSSVLGLRAASFVVIMGIDSVGSMVEATDVTGEVFTRLNSLVASVGESDGAFLAEMKEHGSAVRNRFLDILKAVATVDSGLSLSSVVAHTQQVVRTGASSERVRSAVDAINAVEPAVSYINLPRGILTGLVLRRQRFEIVDAANPGSPPLKGEMTAEATSQANGLRVGDDSYITARIRIEVAFAGDDESAGFRYFLESIEPFNSETRNR